MAVATFESTPSGVRRLSEAASLADTARVLPDGAYTTFRTYGGRRVVRLGRHLERLEESLALQGRPGAIDREAMRRLIGAALRETGFRESRLRVLAAPPRMFVSIEAFTPPPESLFAEGVRCATVAVHRERPHAKDSRFLATAQHAHATLPPGAYEGLMVAEDGAILEGLSSNFFAIVDRVIRTERDRVLLGVTRGLVIEVAAGLAPVEERAARTDERSLFAEAFITSSSRGVVPVVAIDRDAVGDGRPGPVARELRRRYDAAVEREAETI